MQVKFVDLAKQYNVLRDKLVGIFDKVGSSGIYILGDELKQFEIEVADYCGAKYAIGVANGTDAIILALRALDIGSGDEVITVSNTFIATAGAILAVGATPKFVDVKDDLNIDVDQINGAITNKTKAILPVHLAGRSADMDSVLEIAKNNNLSVIEDAAQSIGAKYKGKRVGSFGDAGCFSLHPLKNLHIYGDGGLVTTNSEKLYKKILGLRNHGLKNRDECEYWGYNSRLDEMQAAFGRVKLQYLDEWNSRVRDIARRYSSTLSNVVNTPKLKLYEENVFHNYIIIVENRAKLIKFLEESGVETKIHYPIPIHKQQSVLELGMVITLPRTEYLSEKILSLPIYPELTDKQIDYVIDCIHKYYKENS